MKISEFLLVFVGYIFWNKAGVLALKMIKVNIDQHTVRGNGTVLECKFDLEGETLYAVKWYKDGNEFYRYIPKESPPVQIFDLPGVHVRRESRYDQLHIGPLDLTSSGRYRCEVSGEAPSFTTVSEAGHMVTVALPTDGPKITGGKPRYRVGEPVNVNCTSGTSKPAATLEWFINGEPANSSFQRGPFREYIGREGMETVTLGLHFIVQPHHFQIGTEDMKLKCLATISTIYWQSNEASVEGEKQLRPPMLEVRRTDESFVDDRSRADRVQSDFSATKIFNFITASNASKQACNWYQIYLLISYFFVVRMIALR